MSKANSMLQGFLTYQAHKLVFGPRRKSLEAFVRNYQNPVYIYDLDFIVERMQNMQQALPKVHIYYAMKANPNLQVLKTLKAQGCGMDVVSGGEIQRALEAGFKPSEIIYSGVGKTWREIRWAVENQIHQINVESLPELQRIGRVCEELGKNIDIALRLNPDVDIKTHPYIATGLRDNKFGMTLGQLSEIKTLLRSQPRIQLRGLSMHLGSQMHHLDGFRAALKSLRGIYQELQQEFPKVERFDFGGGLGIFYERQDLSAEINLLQDYGRILQEELRGLRAELQTEPGRWLVGHAGLLLTQVQYVKPTEFKTFAILDTGMHHLLRPALYQAHHSLYPLEERPSARRQIYDVVGPICESSDFIGTSREFPELQEGDLLVIADVGAYGYSMRSDYNLQPAPQEVCI